VIDPAKHPRIEQIVEEYYGFIFRICGKFSVPNDELRDTVHDIVIKILDGVNSFRGDCKFSTWIYRVAANRYKYDLSGNMTTKNGGSYQYDELNRLISSVESGPFLDTKTPQAMTADSDYGGQKTLVVAPENTNIELDQGSTSVGVMFNRLIELTSLTLTPQIANHRVTTQNLEVYVSADGVSYSKSALGSVTTAGGKITVSFSPAVNAIAVKIHCLWDDRTVDYEVDDRATFVNDAGSIVTVTYLEQNRTAGYTYDHEGNRTEETLSESLGADRDYVYSLWQGTNRIKTDGRYAYVFDANGNLTAKGKSYTIGSDGTVSFSQSAGEYWAYTYDLWNRMVSVAKGSAGVGSAQQVASYVYDPEGLRIRKVATLTGLSTDYWYGVDGNVAYEKRSDGRTRAYAYAVGRLVGYDEKVGVTTTRYYTCTDILGSVTAETDSSGKLVGSREYKDFGQAGGTIGGQPNHESLNWYANREYDPDANLVYSDARWYDPDSGTFTTEDPAEYGYNWYQYCGSNPMTSTDPTGLNTSGNGTDPVTGGDNVFVPGVGTVQHHANPDPPVKTPPPPVVNPSPTPAPTPANAPSVDTLPLIPPPTDQGGLDQDNTLFNALVGFLTSGVTADLNKLYHIFGNAEHNLDGFLKGFAGDQAKAFGAIQSATQQQVTAQGITGVFEQVITVDGSQITVRGTVVNGVVQIGTAFIP